MVLHNDDPAETLMWLLRHNWDNGWNYSTTPRTHTGWYDYEAGGQQITVTNPDQNVINGGDTGYTAIGGDGSGRQTWRGVVVVNCWAGTRDECRGVGPNGENVNPKTLAYDMAEHAASIIGSHDDGVIDNESVYNSLGVDNATRLPDTQGQYTVYRWELEAVYTYLT